MDFCVYLLGFIFVQNYFWVLFLCKIKHEVLGFIFVQNYFQEFFCFQDFSNRLSLSKEAKQERQVCQLFSLQGNQNIFAT